MPSIQTLAFKITADTSGFVNGLGMTRKELSAAKQLFEQTRSPIEKYEAALKGIEHLQSKGLSADVAQRSIRQLRDEFWGLDKAAEKAEEKTDDLFTKIAGGVTVGNLLSKAFTATFDLLRSGFETLSSNVEDQFGKALKLGQMAERTGMDAKTLGALEVVASRAGMEFDKFAQSLQKMQIRVGEAAAGGGDAAKVFERLGLSAKQLAGMSVEKQFLAIAEAMRTIPSDTERLGAAAKIFEAEGTDMARLFGLTAEQLAKAREEAERMGIALSESQLNDIATANEAIKEMELAWAGVGRTLAVDVAPAIKSIAMVINEARSQMDAISRVKANVEASLPPGLAEGLKTGVMAGIGSALPGMQLAMGGGAYAGGEFGGLVSDTRSANAAELQTKKMEREQQKQQLDIATRKDQLSAGGVAIAAAMDLTFGLLGGKQQETNNWAVSLKSMQQKAATVRSAASPAGPSFASGPTTAVLKGSTEAFAAERERIRVEDERYRESVKREQAQLEALNNIVINTKPENRTVLEVVEI